MPPKGKAKNPPSQHDKRHENGLAAPGKRVAKQRSTGQLNGQANGKPSSVAVTPPALPSTGLNSGFKFPLPADNTAPVYHRHHSNPQSTSHHNSPTTNAWSSALSNQAARDQYANSSLEGSGRDRTPSDVSMEDVGPYGEMADGLYEHPTTMLIGDLPASAPACKNKSSAMGPSSTISSVSTILASYPLRDAICILIILLALPSSLVVVVQFLFAMLSFVPSSAGLSLSTLPNFKEMFNSSSVGYPALATLLFVDLIFWVLWLPLWRPIQSIFLDLSQVVIAVSLSGAAVSNSGPTYSIATCAVAVCMVHVLRYRAIHLTALDYLRSVIHKMDINFQIDVPSFSAPFYSLSSADSGWPFAIIRTILGIHIFAQGITTCIRRTLVQANESQQVPTTPRSDADAAASLDNYARSSSGTADAVQQPHTVVSTDGRPPGPSPAIRDRAVRDSGNKKKRKQKDQARVQQPLWAAIASTKITFVKNKDQRDAANDAREAASMMDNKTATTSFTNSNTTANSNRIWICEVRDTDIHFRVELGADSTTDVTDCATTVQTNSTSGIDTPKPPFFVRINGATWSSTRISALSDGESARRRNACRFAGEIFDLAPLSSYHCELVSPVNMQVLCSASLITQTAPFAQQTHAIPPSTQHQTLRPASPRTTLKQSIQSAEAKLIETRNRAKKSRKDQRASQTHIKNEIAKCRTSIDDYSIIDGRFKHRLLQISQHKNQADEAITELKAQIDDLGEVPASEQAILQTTKDSRSAALNARDASKKDLEETKKVSERQQSTVKNEIATAQNKQKKLAAKLTQRAQELENLLAKQQADFAARQKREQDRAKAHHTREAKEIEIRSMITGLDDSAHNHARKAHDIWQEISALTSWFAQAAAPGYSGYGSPPTPEGAVSSLNGATSGAHVNGFANGSYAHQSFQPSVFLSAAPALKGSYATAGAVPRGRSSSMLSQYSGFTDNGDDVNFAPSEPRPQQTWPSLEQHGANGDGRKTSNDSDVSDNVVVTNGAAIGLSNGHSNGSNSPRPDAKPFIPAAVSKAPSGPIGSSAGKRSPQTPTLSSPGTNGNRL